jgi:RHS repeat-associated protein
VASQGLAPSDPQATAVSAPIQQASIEPGSTSRYHYSQGRRVLSQEGIADASDLKTNTRQVKYQAGSHRWLADDQTQSPTQYNANGQPNQIGSREYVWDALGRLLEVRQEDKSLAAYTYNHRGERIGKSIGKTTSPAAQGQTTRYLYEDGQVSAELNASGQITRQYLYLAGQPIGVIDTPQGQSLSKQELPAHVLLGLDAQNILKHLWRSLAGNDGQEQTTWLHTNHLGAPEAATDASGQLIWQASYAPFGAARIIQASAGKSNDSSQFTLNLRLPGQYFDAETGLFYNKQRYYDPARGEYLSPDPLGTPDGPNGYSYVRFNPLKYVDPDGLILFAFDGTDNTDDVTWLTTGGRNSSLSNVVQFRNAYNDGTARYVTGVGTDHGATASTRDTYGVISAPTGDSGFNRTGVKRIDRMRLYFDDQADIAPDTEVMQVDIIGFSRGAAEARDFANQIVAKAPGGIYSYQRHNTDGSLRTDALGKPVLACQRVNFRFMGLWDSVLSTNNGRAYSMAIPGAFQYVAQAVALNEYRSEPSSNLVTNSNFWDNSRTHIGSFTDKLHYGGFPLESIGGNSSAPGRTRVEMGFIGAHADIGGGYGATDNGLSTVALSWMVAQAQVAGVKMFAPRVGIDMNSPVIHDQSNALRWGNPTGAPAVQIGSCVLGVGTCDTITPEDRRVNGATSGTTQRNMQFGPPLAGGNRSMVNSDTQTYINYTARDPVTGRRVNTNDLPEIVALRNRTGTVDMAAYMSWLRGHGYVFYGDF